MHICPPPQQAPRTGGCREKVQASIDRRFAAGMPLPGTRNPRTEAITKRFPVFQGKATTQKRVSKPMGFKIASSKSQVLGTVKHVILVHQQCWYPFGWFFGTQKGIKTDGFSKWQVLETSKTRKFGAPAILVPVWVLPRKIEF